MKQCPEHVFKHLILILSQLCLSLCNNKETKQWETKVSETYKLQNSEQTWGCIKSWTVLRAKLSIGPRCSIESLNASWERTNKTDSKIEIWKHWAIGLDSNRKIEITILNETLTDVISLRRRRTVTAKAFWADARSLKKRKEEEKKKQDDLSRVIFVI